MGKRKRGMRVRGREAKINLIDSKYPNTILSKKKFSENKVNWYVQ